MQESVLILRLRSTQSLDEILLLFYWLSYEFMILALDVNLQKDFSSFVAPIVEILTRG